jgi:hypothetical protein
MTKSQFLLAFALVVAVAVCVPFDLKQTPLLAEALTSESKISVIGNSVLSHTSRCDQDSRSLVSMLSDGLRQPVLDLSFNGQSLSEAANFAAASLKNPHIHTVLFPVSLFEFVDWDTDPIRTYALFRLLNPDLDAASLAERMESPGRFSGQESELHAAFDYDGIHYPDYNGIKQHYMSYERDMMRCPENDGANLKFTAASYHHLLMQFPILDKPLSLVSSLGKDAAQRRKSLLVVILPIDFELIAKLGVPGLDALHTKVDHVVQTLSSDGLKVVDLSASLHNNDFADHWCACGHLVETGRQLTAERIIQRIPDMTQNVAVYDH